MKKTILRNLIIAGIVLTTLISCSNGNSGSTGKYINSEDDWLDESVPSLYETYENYFDYVGFAVEYGIVGWSDSNSELYQTYVQKGLAKHGNHITMGNEFKPQFVMQWWGNKPEISGTFTATNGITIQTPKINGFNNVDTILSICKKNGLKMRGHTLAWHSQTDDAFFYEDYDTSKSTVSSKVMEARLEWYIKTVLEHVANWEKQNNNGEHIIWTWDVFNEVTSDGSQNDAATSSDNSHWLRTEGSKWYDIYGNADFVIQAFKYANKYAPADVKLCYNDYGGVYGTSTNNKHKSQLRLVKLILSHKDDATLPTRLDAMGLQSHHSVRVSKSAVENEVKDFINLGINVQITELDVGTWDNYNNTKDIVGTANKQFYSLADAYNAYFKVYLNNRKTESKKGVESITIWGLNDENTWLNTPGQQMWLGECTQYPLLFTKKNNSYYPKGAFFAVIDAAE